MNEVAFPEGFRLERLQRVHPRKSFHCGESRVDDWLARNALQQQDKQLSVTKVLIDAESEIAGYYTLASGQVDFGSLPAEISKQLPRRFLPVAVLAWIGISLTHQGQGLGQHLVAQALRDCHEAGQTFAFVAVIVDCLTQASKAFFARCNFQELPGQTDRLFLSAQRLKAILQST